MKLKEIHPLIGRTVSYRGEDYRLLKIVQRRGRMVYIGQKPGEYVTHYINPMKIDEVAQ